MLGIVCLSFLVALTAASDVIELNDSNFQESVEEHDIMLVEFYAPW